MFASRNDQVADTVRGIDLPLGAIIAIAKWETIKEEGDPPCLLN